MVFVRPHRRKGTGGVRAHERKIQVIGIEKENDSIKVKMLVKDPSTNYKDIQAQATKEANKYIRKNNIPVRRWTITPEFHKLLTIWDYKITDYW